MQIKLWHKQTREDERCSSETPPHHPSRLHQQASEAPVGSSGSGMLNGLAKASPLFPPPYDLRSLAQTEGSQLSEEASGAKPVDFTLTSL